MQTNLERIAPGEVSNLLLERHLARYSFAAEYTRDLCVLDVACGTGYGSIHLLEKGARHVTGVDISEEAIAYAQDHYGCDGVTFTVGDATKLDFQEGSFEAVVSFETIEHIKDYHAFLHETHRVLKPKGVLIVSTPNRRYDAKSPFHYSYFSFAEFKGLLLNNFPEVEFYGQNPLTRLRRVIARLSRALGFLLSWKQKERLRQVFALIRPTKRPRQSIGGTTKAHALPASIRKELDVIESCKYFIAICKKSDSIEDY